MRSFALLLLVGLVELSTLGSAFAPLSSSSLLRSLPASASASAALDSSRPTTAPRTISASHQQSSRLYADITATQEETDSTAGASKQNAFGVVSDAVTGVIFNLLHMQDETGIKDASKNLRVLWARALLHTSGKVKDTVAEKLLPRSTRGLVTSKGGAELLKPTVKFLEWIQARTEFIDSAVDTFLSSSTCQNDIDGSPAECQIVLFGAGYDTRALRYRHTHGDKLQFIEVDLPEVVAGKQRLYEKFAKEQDPDWDFEKEGSNFIPFNLNECGGDTPVSMMDVLREKGGLRDDIPTLFVFEAVLFYVEQDAIENLLGDIMGFMRSWKERGNAEALLCMTDSLKPFVSVPFTSEADKFFSSRGLDLLQHRARWGGAVHFALAANGAESTVTDTATTTSDEQTTASRSKRRERSHGQLGAHVASTSDELVYSYLPTRSNAPELLENPSFDNVWYAVAYAWQIDGYKSKSEAEQAKQRNEPATTTPFATRIWGEPVVIYRDADSNMVCATDVCPHRSAPLSMGTVQDGELVCFYHGWKFGRGAQCTDVPSLSAVAPDKVDPVREGKFRDRVSDAFCQKQKACVQQDGLVWLWRGNVLEADPSKIPSRRRGDMEAVTMDSVLDYNVDYSYIVENNLDSVHLFYLHDGSVPPLESIGMMNKNLDLLRLSAFKDDCGMGHLGKLGDGGRPKKLIRFDPPNIVRHGGVSGFEEEFHIIPIAPHRTRVLLRQHIPKGPILSTISSLPGVMPTINALVNNWNYHIGLEDASVMEGQSHLVEEFGAPRMKQGGLGDDLITKYWRWRDQAHEKLNEDSEEGAFVSPYFSSYADDGSPVGIATGNSVFGDARAASSRQAAQQVLGAVHLDSDPMAAEEAKWGIKQQYSRNTPIAEYPPMNYKAYKKSLYWDDITKKILMGQEPSSSMVKTTNEPKK